MTLAQLADYVCAKVGATDTQSVEICKTFLTRRNQMIWDFGLWADSQRLITVEASDLDFTEIVFPATVERVINIRNVTTQMNLLGVSIGMLFDYNTDVLERFGASTNFVHLPTSLAAFAVDVGTVTFDATEILGSDIALITIHGTDANGTPVSEEVSVTISATAEATTIDFTGKVGSDFDNGGFGRYVIINADATTTVAVCFVPTGSFTPGGTGTTETIGIAIDPADDAAAIAIACTAAGLFTGLFSVSSDGNTATFTALIAGPLPDATDFNASVPLSIVQGALGVETTSTTSFSELYYLSSELTQPSIPFENEDGDVLGEFVGPLFPEGYVATRVQKIKVYPAPNEQQTYLAQVKLVCQPLDTDDSEPLLKGMDNTLLAFAQADMLQRQRQYDKAKAVEAQAQGQLQIMLDLEKNQQAMIYQIQPALVNTEWYCQDGYGTPWWGGQ